MRIVEQGIYSDSGEQWSALLYAGDRLVATAHGFPSRMAARSAGEFLMSGIAAEWRLMHAIPDSVVDAGVAGWKEDVEFEAQSQCDCPQDAEIDQSGFERRRVRAVLSASSQAWARHVLAEQA